MANCWHTKQQINTKRLLNCKEKQRGCKGLGSSLIKSKEIADNRDCWAIFVMCMWSNTMKGSMFVVLCYLMIQIGGRLDEIATLAKSHIKAKRVKDHHGLKEYTVLKG
eukprot:5162631-Ditylum_brightwellii.AAC.1